MRIYYVTVMIQLSCVLSVTLGGQDNQKLFQIFVANPGKKCRVLSLQDCRFIYCLHKPPYSLLPIYFLVAVQLKQILLRDSLWNVQTFFLFLFFPLSLSLFSCLSFFLYHFYSSYVSILVIPSIILIYLSTLNSFDNSK